MIFVLKENKTLQDSSIIEKNSRLEYIKKDISDNMIQVKYHEIDIEKVFWVYEHEIKKIKL